VAVAEAIGVVVIVAAKMAIAVAVEVTEGKEVAGVVAVGATLEKGHRTRVVVLREEVAGGVEA
jgi:hypothetical protein